MKNIVNWRQQAEFWGSLVTGNDPLDTYFYACQAATAAQRHLNPKHKKAFETGEHYQKRMDSYSRLDRDEIT